MPRPFRFPPFFAGAHFHSSTRFSHRTDLASHLPQICTMVLHKNKWDHKSKILYLKKHGLTRPKQAKEVTPKWSGKKSAKSSQTYDPLEYDLDDEWRSDDDALVDFFYPDVSEQNVSVDIKKLLKKQIVNSLRARQEEETAEPETTYNEEDGIYLGKPPSKFNSADDGSRQLSHADNEPQHGYNPETQLTQEELDFLPPELEARLSEFVISDFSRSRTRHIPQAKDESLLEYGIDDLKKTVKNVSYDNKKPTDFDDVDVDDLDGFRIGQDFAEFRNPQAEVRVLSELEKGEHAERTEKLQRAQFLSDIKKTFGETKHAPVLEINNFNAADDHQMKVLHSRLTTEAPKNLDLADDLEELLGGNWKQDDDPVTQEDDFLDELLK